MLHGNKVYIRLMEEKDVVYKVKWINDPEIRHTLNFEYPISEIGTHKWLHSVSTNPARKDFVVCSKENDEPIGYCGLLGIDYKNSKAESYMGIGEKSFQGQGIGFEIRKILLDYAFYELNLNKVYAYVWKENTPMIKLNEKVGFQKEGLIREDIQSHGEKRDRYIMGILKSEYLNKNES
ncbi:GNAT family N-acetyltransferase [Lederbergia sp. NSJ-179]|uniref:GNAT family N-acetyltransferase n=1 Tax=Lederbergia sp. NSJ-179 TaxID=2931402 RepID=UPI001FD392CD|nr:GNAT family protein [Lederbergia sp. NSJ-179]MCJ7840670.1 GNAT family N-acetyltransferase [Lederbergia sp. NSJ-179]